jgi:drug/metabolite transporter (DMT)-like permease
MQTYSFRFVPAGEGSLLAMTAVVYSSFVGVFLFDEPFTHTILIGAALVFASAGYLAFRYDTNREA